MQRDEVIRILNQHADELRGMGVKSLALFGSTARDEAVADSDVDILADFEEPMGLFGVFRIQHRLEEVLGGRKVDLVQRGAEHPALRERILKEAVHVG